MEDLAQLDKYRKVLLESEHMAGHCQREKLFLLQSKLCADYKEEHKLPPPYVELVTADEQKEQ